MVAMGKRQTQRRFRTEGVTFDQDARFEYLTGFHKRKLLRRKQAKEEADRRLKAVKTEERRKLRGSRKEKLKKHIEAVEATIGPVLDDPSEIIESQEEDNSDVHIDDMVTASQNNVRRTDEFIEGDRHATVTVEPIDLNQSSEDGASDEAELAVEMKKFNGATPPHKPRAQNPKKERSKTEKKKKFRYLSKAERKDTRRKDALERKKRTGRTKELKLRKKR